MISNVTTGSGFYGAVYYILKKEKNPEILMGEGIYLDEKLTGKDLALSITNQFEEIKKGSITKPVFHSSLSFSKQDKINDQLMVQVAENYMEKMGFEKNQYIVVKHNDTDHKHLHIVANRVGYDGNYNKLDWIIKRSINACREIEKEYGLEIVSEKRKENQNIKSEVKSKLTQYHKETDSYEKFKEKAVENGFVVKENKSKDGTVRGIGFSFDNHYFKGSEIGLSLRKIKEKYGEKNPLQAKVEATFRNLQNTSLLKNKEDIIEIFSYLGIKAKIEKEVMYFENKSYTYQKKLPKNLNGQSVLNKMNQKDRQIFGMLVKDYLYNLGRKEPNKMGQKLKNAYAHFYSKNKRDKLKEDGKINKSMESFYEKRFKAMEKHKNYARRSKMGKKVGKGLSYKKASDEENKEELENERTR